MNQLVGTHYSYTSLKGATGTINAVAVLKYFRQPEKSRGSGYSLFATITDPSLDGSKLPCMFFSDSLDNLRVIRAPGDILVMHRLVIGQFRGQPQGCGYCTTGFALAVFSGSPTDPLVPRMSPKCCSYGDHELSLVQHLRGWFNSPSCPVERETTTTTTRADVQAPKSTRLWRLKANQFEQVEGQVVSIYRYPDADNCVILYIWDGSPSDHESIHPIFSGPPKDHFPRLLQFSLHDPHLVALTGHGLNNSPHVPFSDMSSDENRGGLLAVYRYLQEDWSVPIYIYDEHAVSTAVRELKPGSLVRIRNLHVTQCRSFECERPGCLRLTVHSGGSKFGRGVSFIGSQASFNTQVAGLANRDDTDTLRDINRDDLLTNLLRALDERKPRLACPSNATERERRVPLTIAQATNLPSILKRGNAASTDTSFPDSWSPIMQTSESDRNGAAFRLSTRVRSVFPTSMDDMCDCLILICEKCSSAIRFSCLQDLGSQICACCSTSSAVDRHLTLFPVFLIHVEDATGSLILSASGRTIPRIFLHPSGSQCGLAPPLCCATADEVWMHSIMELLHPVTLSTGSSVLTQIMEKLSSLIGCWIDVEVKASWEASWGCRIPPAEHLNMKFELLDNSDFLWS